MCNNYNNDKTLVGWAEAFRDFLAIEMHIPPGELSNHPWKTDVYPKYQGLFVRPVDPQDLSAGVEPAVGRWGIVPFFHRKPASAWSFPTNNCRSEEMATKASFRDALKSKRCIIPATSFCEHTGPKGKMTKHRISHGRDGALFLAGLWASHTFEGEVTESYTMLMQPAEGDHDMARFHNRQPVFLDRDSARTWLDLSADYTSVLHAPANGMLAFDPPEPALS